MRSLEMEKLYFNDDDISRVKKSLCELKVCGKVWEHPENKELKKKIKNYILSKRNTCAYCLRSFQGEHFMSIDVEHILPKSKFPKYVFTMKNISIACKRCNLKFKRDKIDFLSNDFNTRKPFISRYYKFSHPVLDRKNKMELISIRLSNEINIVRYIKPCNDHKSNFTYDYFKLSEIEVASIDSAQGITKLIDFLSVYKAP